MHRNVPAENASAQAMNHCRPAVEASAEIKNQHADRNRERKQRVHGMTPRQAPAAASHQRADRHGIEWLVKKDHEKRAEPRKPRRAITAMLHGRRKRDAIEHAVQHQSQRGATPRQAMLVVCVMLGLVCMVVRMRVRMMRFV
jgi:hypothetical protein